MNRSKKIINSFFEMLPQADRPFGVYVTPLSQTDRTNFEQLLPSLNINYTPMPEIGSYFFPCSKENYEQVKSVTSINKSINLTFNQIF